MLVKHVGLASDTFARYPSPVPTRVMAVHAFVEKDQKTEAMSWFTSQQSIKLDASDELEEAEREMAKARG